MNELHYEIDGNKFILISYKEMKQGVEYIIKEIENHSIFSKFEESGQTKLLDMLREQYPEYFI